MTANVTNELIYEVLRQLQGDVAAIKNTQADHTHHLIRAREDINNLRADILRFETGQAQIQVRLERIEKRLNLVYA